MSIFVVVYDGAYGISFDIVKANSIEEARKVSGAREHDEVIPVDSLEGGDNTVLYSCQPTG